MVSALSDYFAYAFERKWMNSDPLRSLKYRRSTVTIAGQLDFFQLLCAEGFRKPVVERLVWADFVDPMLQHHRAKLRVGKRIVAIRPELWRSLDVQFRALAARQDLPRLLKRRIA
jgi:hypothetical protein